ncbi:MAG: peptidylprolyl isomerase [Rikenellaceae bacterium]|nr:peptidylprolyl isomerase [Rikenellaceae bacterium]
MVNKLLTALLCVLFLLNGYEKVVAQNRQIAEQVVAVVGNSMILLSEVEETMRAIEQEQKERGYTIDGDVRCHALELNMMRKLLARQADIDSVYVRNSRGLEDRLNDHIDDLIIQHGSLAAVEQYYRKPVYSIKDEVRERFMEMYKAIEMEDHIRSKVTIIPSEVERYYRKLNRDSLPMVPEQYVYGHIVLYPSSSEDAKLRAKERLLELRERVINGDRFATLARLYSADGSASSGGELDYMRKEYFEKPFGDALEKLKIGQISDIVETVYGFHLIEMMDIRNGEYKVRHILIRPEFAQEEIIENQNKLDSIGNEIRSGNISFAEAAEKFSEDKLSRFNGGIASNNELAELQLMDPKYTTTKLIRENIGLDYNIIRDLKVGEISRAQQTYDIHGNDIVKIIQLMEIIPTHRANIKDDFNYIEEYALMAKQDEVYSSWLKKIIRSMYITIDPNFQSCEFEYSEWIK